MKRYTTLGLLALLITAAITTWTAFANPVPENGDETAETQEGIKWMGFEEAVAASKKKPKKIFIDVYTDWCGWCKRMDATTFKDPEVVKYMNENYYAVKFDAEGRDNIIFKEQVFRYAADKKKHELAIALLQGKMSFPSTVYLDEKQDVITVVPGYLKSDRMTRVLTFFEEGYYKKMAFDKFEAQYDELTTKKK